MSSVPYLMSNGRPFASRLSRPASSIAVVRYVVPMVANLESNVCFCEGGKETRDRSHSRRRRVGGGRERVLVREAFDSSTLQHFNKAGADWLGKRATARGWGSGWCAKAATAAPMAPSVETARAVTVSRALLRFTLLTGWLCSSALAKNAATPRQVDLSSRCRLY